MEDTEEEEEEEEGGVRRGRERREHVKGAMAEPSPLGALSHSYSMTKAMCKRVKSKRFLQFATESAEKEANERERERERDRERRQASHCLLS